MSLTATPVPLGPYGVWLRHDIATPELATAVERLGYGTLWLGGSPGADLKAAGDVLAATRRLSVATGIVNIWSAGAEPVADSWHRLEAEHPGRFLLGIGAGHRELDGPGAEKPYGAVSRYLDVLDAREVPADRRVLAALGPRMLKLSAERAAGSHPYLVHPEFSRTARAELGPEALLAPEQKVALGTDRAETRAVGRTGLEPYLGLRMTNYLGNFRRMGFDDPDFADGGSDRLIDGVVAQGTPEEAAEVLRAHIAAGADHVAVQPLAHDDDPLPVLTALAPVLGLTAVDA